MTLLAVVVQVAAVVTVMVAVAAVAVVGRSRLGRVRGRARARLQEVTPFAGLFVLVLFANRIAREVGPAVSWLYGVNITSTLYRADGFLLQPVFGEGAPQVVVFLQSFATPGLTAVFGFAYVYGYVFLVLFPLVAYFALESPEPLKRTIVAYGANYLLGIVCYVLFIAYGPRNVLTESVDQLLYATYPQYQFLTYSINTSVNVFPSLHTSLAVTVAMLAWLTRETYPRWVPVATGLATSVVLATMYLGIHWASDVVAGVVLAYVSVAIGRRYEDRSPDPDRFVPAGLSRVLAR